MTTVKDYIDCPRCGKRKIRADLPMCAECEKRTGQSKRRTGPPEE